MMDNYMPVREFGECQIEVAELIEQMNRMTTGGMEKLLARDEVLICQVRAVLVTDDIIKKLERI